ncbi:hypothetical protein DFH09DRAFT_1067994 [Mycena vulgaris]|nr:hypothetical protein DFH09DRAFT_1067994 [Mycena vulgaris]
MTRLVESGMALDAQLPLLKQTKQKGDLLCSLCYYPILVTPENENGLFTKAYSHRINALAKIRLRLDWDAPSIHVTRRQKILADGSIVWGSVHEFLCFDKSTCVLYIDVLDPHLEDPVLGHLSICLTDLVEATIAKRGPWPLSGSTTGKLVVSAEWRPLNLAPGL